MKPCSAPASSFTRESLLTAVLNRLPRQTEKARDGAAVEGFSTAGLWRIR